MFEYFYHQTLRKSVALFGTLFNDIKVVRTNAAGKTLNQLKVPLAYAPRAKYLERIRQVQDFEEDTKIALKLPRMSFEISSISYDTGRKLPKMNNFYRYLSTSDTSATKFLSPVPYTISFQLNIFAKNQDDALQIVEQIIPYFNPQYTLSIKPFSEYSDIVQDVPVTITGVTFSDEFDGAQEQRRTIIYTVDFSMNILFYGPLKTNDLIREAITDVHLDNYRGVDSDGKAVTVTVGIDPDSAGPLDDFGFNTEVDYHNE